MKEGRRKRSKEQDSNTGKREKRGDGTRMNKLKVQRRMDEGRKEARKRRRH